jgi:hypothetical protein
MNDIISISVDPAIAHAYNEISTEDRKKIQLVLRLQVSELLNSSDVSLTQLMDEIGAKAEAKGLTPEILETLLNED